MGAELGRRRPAARDGTVACKPAQNALNFEMTVKRQSRSATGDALI